MPDFLPDRLNEPPSVFNGCSWEELGMVAIVSAAISLMLGIVVIAMGASWIILFAFVTCGTLIGTYIGSLIMSKIKAGKPAGHYKVQAHLMLQKIGLKNRTAILKTQSWDVGGE